MAEENKEKFEQNKDQELSQINSIMNQMSNSPGRDFESNMQEEDIISESQSKGLNVVNINVENTFEDPTLPKNDDFYTQLEFEEIEEKFKAYIEYLKKRNQQMTKEIKKAEAFNPQTLGHTYNAGNNNKFLTDCPPEILESWTTVVQNGKQRICSRLNENVKNQKHGKLVSKQIVVKSRDIANLNGESSFKE